MTAEHGAVRYAGECGARWYPDMGERPPARCIAEPEWLRRHPGEGSAAR